MDLGCGLIALYFTHLCSTVVVFFFFPFLFHFYALLVVYFYIYGFGDYDMVQVVTFLHSTFCQCSPRIKCSRQKPWFRWLMLFSDLRLHMLGFVLKMSLADLTITSWSSNSMILAVFFLVLLLFQMTRRLLSVLHMLPI